MSNQPSGVLPSGIEVLVASVGGVGTTMLLRHIGKFRKTNHPSDHDGLKHIPIPPTDVGGTAKYVYVFGDPIDSVISLFRRNYQSQQSRKLQRFQASKSIIGSGTTLHSYARHRVDRLPIKRHFQNWHSFYLAVPTLFVRYETMHDNVEAIACFAGLPRSFVDDFPANQPRQSRLNDLPIDVRNGLLAMYGDFRTELDQLPDCFLRQPSVSATQVTTP
ncbi:sulfotransferase domain-containing protein [Aporhodopirellula aestuarii]|uniref:Sulfotransferase domain-containing protein n=1 Tax=Aporhodopirellula aestuarii TaxID=2950107 RepID=A0ABT0U1B4_9BACT|nr:sulfotransferase domain-containing protein [Aporhodopirellula aestuarii]MCM2370663.1 sulfotransferase domain-containing protein [Aporhodopirellula aestuarii]